MEVNSGLAEVRKNVPIRLSIQQSGLTTQNLAVSFSKTVIEIDSEIFYTSTGFDNKGKVVLISYACGSTFIPASR